MREFLWGCSATGAVVVAMFFLRFWWSSRDRLFVLFAVAFALLAVNWTFLAAFRPGDEARSLAFLVRLAAFAIIAGAIVDKNRRG